MEVARFLASLGMAFIGMVAYHFMEPAGIFLLVCSANILYQKL